MRQARPGAEALSAPRLGASCLGVVRGMGLSAICLGFSKNESRGNRLFVLASHGARLLEAELSCSGSHVSGEPVADWVITVSHVIHAPFSIHVLTFTQTALRAPTRLSFTMSFGSPSSFEEAVLGAGGSRRAR